MQKVKKLKKSNFSPAVKKKSNNVKSMGRGRRKISTDLFIPSENLSSSAILIHGREGIGKTTLINQFGKIHYFMFERNTSFALYQDLIPTWEDFLDLKDDLIEGNYDRDGISLDGPKIAYDQVMSYACSKYGFSHPGKMNDMGDSWNKVRHEFVNPLREIINSRFGFLVSCHTVEKEVTKIDGFTYKMFAPDLQKAAYELLVGEFDNVFYYFFEDGQRWLQIVPDEHIVAKNRMDGHFLTKEGEKIFKIPMGESKEEAYKNLMRAFNNKQKNSYKPKPKKDLKKLKKTKGSSNSDE